MKKITNINDRYGVLDDMGKVKALIAEVEHEFLKFYGPTKTRRAGVRARKKVMRTIENLYVIRKNLLKQAQDYSSEY